MSAEPVSRPNTKQRSTNVPGVKWNIFTTVVPRNSNPVLKNIFKNTFSNPNYGKSFPMHPYQKVGQAMHQSQKTEDRGQKTEEATASDSSESGNGERKEKKNDGKKSDEPVEGEVVS